MRAWLLSPLVLFAACDGVRADEGADATMHVDGASFVRGDLPAGTSGPGVRSVTTAATFAAGATDRSLSGELDPEATAVAFALAGDLGYWVLRADVPSASALDAPTFATLVSFARRARTGARELVVRAVDRDGRFGPPLVKPIILTDRARPDGQLVISLTWSEKADLDLHVVDPRGVEVFERNPSSYEPPPAGSPPEPPGTPHDGGVLDIDGNGSCVLDGRGAENVVWSDPPPPGRYLVRVDTFSLCGDPVARWRVEAFLHGVRVGAAEGISTETDTRFSHTRGAGVLALELDVP